MKSMEISEESRRKIEACFTSIGGVKSFNAFSRVTPEQQKCVVYLKQVHDTVFSSKSRDVFLGELIVCIAGMEDDEDGEQISEAIFSQYRFYRTYIHDFIFYPEKFDFLLRCIEEGVCVVTKTSRFMSLIDRICAPKVQRLPDIVVSYETLLAEDEERRINSFTLRKNWKCTVPPLVPSPSAVSNANDASAAPDP